MQRRTFETRAQPRADRPGRRSALWLCLISALLVVAACGGDARSTDPGENGHGPGASSDEASGEGTLGGGEQVGASGAPGAEGAGEGAGTSDTERDERSAEGATPHAAGGEPAGTPAATDTAEPGEPLAWDSEIVCRIPPMAIARPAACAAGASYPECKWAMPGTTDAQGLYTRWRNTIDEHTWGRPALVGVLLATAYAFRQRFPNQELLIGDLDAPGPRHMTHKTGVDVDLYLPNTLLVENLGARRYRPNYRTMSNVNIEHARHRVEALARILAVCTEGRVRIYYNDTVVRDRFHTWFDARGLVTPFGRPMQRHNPLHDFHFHVTIAEDTPLPQWLRPFTGEHPVREIDAPPDIEGVTVFAPRTP